MLYIKNDLFHSNTFKTHQHTQQRKTPELHAPLKNSYNFTSYIIQTTKYNSIN